MMCNEWLQTHPDVLARVSTVARRAVDELGAENSELRRRLSAFLASTSH
jgi:hypothetical protein